LKLGNKGSGVVFQAGLAIALVSNLERKIGFMKSGRCLMQILQTEREHSEAAEEQRCLAL
jgi:hypothetical protein